MIIPHSDWDALSVGPEFPDASFDEAGSFDELLDVVASGADPKVFQLDIFFPGFVPAKSIPDLRRRFPRTTIIVVSMTDRQSLINEVIASGADGFLGKALPPEEFVSGVRRILDGEILVQVGPPGAMTTGQTDLLPSLTPRQREVLQLVAQGMTNKEIGRALEISPVTVRMHVSEILRALTLPRARPPLPPLRVLSD